MRITKQRNAAIAISNSSSPLRNRPHLSPEAALIQQQARSWHDTHSINDVQGINPDLPPRKTVVRSSKVKIAVTRILITPSSKITLPEATLRAGVC